jgi:transcriptional regulator with XRE-family HTH domain
MSKTEHIGERIRRIRQSRGVSLRKVAQEVGVSPSLISQVETGKSSLSVATLYSLAALFGVSSDELLGITQERPRDLASSVTTPVPTPEVQRADENPVIEMEGGVRWERLASSPDRRVESLLVTYQPGATGSSAGTLTRHSGFEHALILEGELTLQLEFDEYVLRPGDSLQFESARPHLYTNRGDTIARGVWFVTGRRSATLDSERAEEKVSPAAPTRVVAVDVLRRFDSME